jgi:hypothetical protein
MSNEPRLITPEGQVVRLSPVEYQRVLAVLIAPPKSPARPLLAETRVLLNELRGKYAAGPSLTQALLNERRREREREAAKLRRYARTA